MARKKKEEVLEESTEPILEEPKEEFYTLRMGETLEDVAKKFGLNVDRLKEINGEVFGTNQIKLK